jgi:chromate reductase, NAD(P)H dehydrogenase (quinone)
VDHSTIRSRRKGSHGYVPESINRILSKALIRLAPHDLEFNEIPIGNLPLYSPDYDEDYPPEATALKEAIAGSDAVLFVTPEYNRSIPGALKNAIDWASRPWGKTPSITFRLP